MLWMAKRKREEKGKEDCGAALAMLEPLRQKDTKMHEEES